MSNGVVSPGATVDLIDAGGNPKLKVKSRKRRKKKKDNLKNDYRLAMVLVCTYSCL